ncbi:hypothetical protein IJ556_03870 [bacterium]|nr:hypothetical protein [bacterium]
MSLVAAVICGFSACGGDDPEVIPTPPNPTEKPGEVTFSIGNNGSGTITGTGTSSDPVVVEQGKTAELAIGQESRYTDPDGTVFNCKPKATIKLSLPEETLYVKDLKTLLTVKENSKVQSEKKEGEVTLKQTVQKFDVGGKEITFDLAHEIYTHLNSQKKNIEMPYIKVNPAQYGKASADTRSAVAVTGIRLTPRVPQTRATVTDSATYDVNVSFNLDLESVNTKAADPQNLSFEVNFTSVVTTSNEVPDPSLSYAFSISQLEGTTSQTSPYIIDGGKTLSIEWSQDAQYSYYSVAQKQMVEVKYAPKAHMTLSTTQDTLWIDSKDELAEQQIGDVNSNISGENPILNAYTQAIEFGEQQLNLAWDYETYPNIEVEGNDVALPYLKLEAPQLLNVQVNEKPDITKAGKTYKVYEVVATMRQEIATVNAPQSQSQSVEYIVKYTAAQEVKLVSVEYRKGYKWFEAHDNIPLTIRYVVYRDRTYSTGEVITDEFWSGATSIEHGDSISNFDGRSVRNVYKSSRPTVDFYYLGGGVSSDRNLRKYHVCHGKMAVPDLSQLNCNIHDLEYTISVPGEWADYIGYDAKFNPDNPVEDWYTRDIERRSLVSLFYHNNDYMLRAYTTGIRFYDRFLYIDGRLIDFLDEKMTYDHQFKVDDITMPTGEPAKVFTNEFRSKYLGMDFYSACVDTVYQYTTPPEYTEYIP